MLVKYDALRLPVAGSCEFSRKVLIPISKLSVDSAIDGENEK